VLTPDQLVSLTEVVRDADHNVKCINIHSPQLQQTAAILAALTLHVKQLQLEVTNLGQQLLDLRKR